MRTAKPAPLRLRARAERILAALVVRIRLAQGEPTQALEPLELPERRAGR